MIHQNVIHQKDLFEFMLRQIKRTADDHGDRLPQAFGRWFGNMFFSGVSNIAISDGAGDGKVDLLVTCQAAKTVRYRILNTKFTGEYAKASPVSFYDEITRYWQAFENQGNHGGPAVAQGSLNLLFDEETYSQIRTTPPELAYQLYVLAEMNDRVLRTWAARKQYISNVKGYIDLAAFAWLCKILRQGGVAFGKEDVNQAFETQYESRRRTWETTIKGVVDLIVADLDKASASALRREGKRLTPGNYFKNTTLIGALMAKARSAPSSQGRYSVSLIPHHSATGGAASTAGCVEGCDRHAGGHHSRDFG